MIQSSEIQKERQLKAVVAEDHLDGHETVPAIEIVNLCKTFGKNRAVDNLSLTVQRGEIFGLLGPNGSGKTTTINMISGLSAPSSGVVRILGYDVQRHPMQVRRCLGCVPQETALFDELSALHNMEYHAALYGVPRREQKERIATMLELVHLYDRRKDLVKTFSGGMKRRLALARALLHRPQVLYLDEPSLGVDVQNRRALYDFILQLPSQGVTVLLTTNDMAEAQALCSHVAIIDGGVLQVVDTPQNLRQKHTGGTVIDMIVVSTEGTAVLAQELEHLAGIETVQYEEDHLTITTSEGLDVLPLILQVTMQQGGIIRKMSIQEAQLEEAFLQITGQLLRD